MPLHDDYQTVPVLLVDPDAQSRSLVRDQLAYGPMIGRFRVFEAASVAEALMCLATNAADVLRHTGPARHRCHRDRASRARGGRVDAAPADPS